MTKNDGHCIINLGNEKEDVIMKFKRVIAAVLSVVMLVLAVPAVYAEGSVVFSFSSDKPSGSEVSLGDTVTYTVSLDESSGFAFGTLFFAPTDNLAYVSATYKGESVSTEKAETGENAGAYGVIIAGEPVTGTNDGLCTITFKVIDKGDISVRFYVYQLNDGNAFVSPTVNNDTIAHTGKELSTPVITTASLPEAVMGYEYSCKIVGSDDEFLNYSYEGTLPSGMTLDADGTLRGTPTQFGSFPITVKATLLGELVSEPKELTLTVLEKPRALELVDGSGYEIDGGLLRGVVEETELSLLLTHFKNNERVKVFDGDGLEVTASDEYVGTGYTVSLMHGDEKVHTVTVVILGDVNGNGRVDSNDYQRIRGYVFGNYIIEGAYFEAACVSGGSDVKPVDYQKVRSHVFGNYNIFE